MALIVVVLLQIILLRAMFANQTGDYKTPSNIGLTCADALGSVIWQLAGLAVAGQVLAGIAVWLCVLRGVQRIIQVLVYLPVSYLLLLLGVHIAASFIGTAWVLLSLKKQVYPLAGRDGDLDMMEDGEVQVL
jgi:hypothetical protein